ncbi:MAG: hypothetical protein H6510_10755 [Acidobacteria bacterium]|nr:hypothetical protein [Acidobacteriota bacterium]MCB9398289.1 hypothetical protein [Acidobacteriota bacterium]
MKKWMFCLLFLSAPMFAGLELGLQAGAFSPTKGIEDNDNGLVLGVDLWFKFTFIGAKIEGFYVDSSGRLEDELGDGFGEANLDISNIFAVDFMYFPVASTFFLQVGANYTNLDVKDVNRDVIENEWGLDLGLGVSLFDKLMIQGKIMYTPNAIKDSAVDTISGLDSSDLTGYMVTVGYHF